MLYKITRVDDGVVIGRYNDYADALMVFNDLIHNDKSTYILTLGLWF